MDETSLAIERPASAALLKTWLKRSKRSRQLKVQGYKEKVSIVSSASACDFNRDFLVNCRGFKTPKHKACGLTDYCPSCHWQQVGQPAWMTFKDSFRKAKPWAAVSFELTNCDGCFSWGPKAKLIERCGLPAALLLLAFDVWGIRERARLCFAFVSALQSAGLVAGALVALDCAVRFIPLKSGAVSEAVTVHIHVLANLSRHVSLEEWRSTYQGAVAACAGRGFQPDLLVAELKSETAFRKWFRYCLKPLCFEKFYRAGGIVCKDRPEAFNAHFDTVLFSDLCGCEGYTHIPAKRRYLGNMAARKPEFIGKRYLRKRIGKKRFNALRLREREPSLGPLTTKERKQFAYECLRRKQEAGRLWAERKCRFSPTPMNIN